MKSNYTDFSKFPGSKRVWSYFSDITRKEIFIEAVKDIRKKYDIPKNGFKIRNNTYSIPDEWRYVNDERKNEKLKNDISFLCEKIHLNPSSFNNVLETYLFYNEFIYLDELPHLDYGLCSISTESDEKFFKEDNEKNNQIFLDEKFFPILLKISPYASKREILEFINKNFTEIKKLQKPYVNKDIRLGRIQKKKNQERDDFIYNHKHLSLKKILKLISERFDEVLDEGHIGKIISIEKNRRKKM